MIAQAEPLRRPSLLEEMAGVDFKPCRIPPLERVLHYVSLTTGVSVVRYAEDSEPRPQMVIQTGPKIPHAHKRLALFFDSARADHENDALAQQAITILQAEGRALVPLALASQLSRALVRREAEQRADHETIRQLSAVVASQQQALEAQVCAPSPEQPSSPHTGR